MPCVTALLEPAGGVTALEAVALAIGFRLGVGCVPDFSLVAVLVEPGAEVTALEAVALVADRLELEAVG
jgi:hypothetical protein